MPTKFHSLIQYALVAMLRSLGVAAYPELTVRVSATKYLVPDVCVANEFSGPYPTDPVVLCCEVLSPEDSIGAAFTKCEKYHTWGVPFCWVIDPVKRSTWEYHAGGEPVHVNDVLQAGKIIVSVGELFCALDTKQP